MIKIKRVYEEPSRDDGFRILVDRVWPRGVTKDRAATNLWLKEIAPSDGLRKWFSHDPEKWQEFRRKYEAELKAKGELVNDIRKAEKEHGTVTLVYSARDEKHNQAAALSIFMTKTKADHKRSDVPSRSAKTPQVSNMLSSFV